MVSRLLRLSSALWRVSPSIAAGWTQAPRITAKASAMVAIRQQPLRDNYIEQLRTGTESHRGTASTSNRVGSDDDDSADLGLNEDDWRVALRRRGTWENPVPIASAVGALERVVACSGAGPGGHHPTLYMVVKAGHPRQCEHPCCKQVFMLSNERSPFAS